MYRCILLLGCSIGERTMHDFLCIIFCVYHAMRTFFWSCTPFRSIKYDSCPYVLMNSCPYACMNACPWGLVSDCLCVFAFNLMRVMRQRNIRRIRFQKEIYLLGKFLITVWCHISHGDYLVGSNAWYYSLIPCFGTITRTRTQTRRHRLTYTHTHTLTHPHTYSHSLIHSRTDNCALMSLSELVGRIPH